MQTHAIVGFAFLVSLVAGCDFDDCREGAARCRGNTAENCELAYSDSSAPTVWSGEDCGERSCQTHGGSAFCAVNPDPDPRCEEGLDTCDGDVLVQCRGPYAVKVAACDEATSGAGPYCLTHEEGALCSAFEEPHLACWGTTAPLPRCSENNLLTCELGFATRNEPCGDGACISDSVAFCALAPVRDPKCPDDHFGSYCSGDILIHCRLGYAVEEVPCEAPLRCQAGGGWHGECVRK